MQQHSMDINVENELTLNSEQSEKQLNNVANNLSAQNENTVEKIMNNQSLELTNEIAINRQSEYRNESFENTEKRKEIINVPKIKVATFAKMCGDDDVLKNSLINVEAAKSFESKEENLENIQHDSYAIKQELTDDDVLDQLEELETFVMRTPVYNTRENEESDSKCEMNVDQVKEEEVDCKLTVPMLEEGEIPPSIKQEEDSEEDIMSKELKREIMYSERGDLHFQLKQKESMAKERFKNFSRILEYSYPPYTHFLRKVEKETGYHLCKLEESRHGPWSIRHTNRWKLKCHKIFVKDEDNSDMPGTLSNSKIVWKIAPNSSPDINLENDPTVPPFILHIIKLFEDFLTNTELIQKEASKFEFTKNINKREFTAMTMRANCNNQVMVVIIGYNITPQMMELLKKYFTNEVGTNCNVTSLYCKSYIPKVSTKNFSTTTFLYGSQVITETIGNICLQLTPRTNFWSNVSGLEILAQTINDFFTPVLENTTLVDIGCGIGLLSLMMANKYKQVIGLDASAEIDEAEVTRKFNKIKNVMFIKESPESIEALFEDLHGHEKVNAIINNNVNSGRSVETMLNLRKLFSLKRIVFIATFTKHSQRVIRELMRPSDEIMGNPFIPVRACVVDTIPDNDHFEIVVLMQRRVMRRLKPEPISREWIEISPSKSSIKEDSKIVIDVEEVHNKKRSYDSVEVYRKMPKRLEDRVLYELPQRRKNYVGSNYSHRSPSPMPRDHINNRSRGRPEIESSEIDILENVKQQQIILEEVTNKLSSSAMDPNTAKQIKDMLSIALEKTNKLQTKLPLITTAVTTCEESAKLLKQKKLKISSPSPSPPPKINLPKLEPGVSKKYQNIQPLEPNLVAPIGGRRAPKPPKTAADLEAKAARRKLNERLRKNILEQNGWSIDASPPRFLQEGSPPRQLPVREPSPGWVSPVGSPKRYPSVVMMNALPKPLSPSPPPKLKYYHSSHYSNRSPPPSHRRYDHSPHRRGYDSPPRHHRDYYGSPPRRAVSPAPRRYTTSSSSSYSTSPSRYSRSPRRYSRSPRRYSRSPSRRYSRSPQRYSRSRSPLSRSYSPSRRKIYSYSPSPMSSSKRPVSPICSPSPPPIRHESRKWPPSPSTSSLNRFEDDWELSPTGSKKSHFEDVKEVRHRYEERPVDKKKASKKLRRSPEVFMEWYKPHLIEHSPSRQVMPEPSKNMQGEEEAFDLVSSRDPRLRGKKALPPLRKKNAPEKPSIAKTVTDKIVSAKIKEDDKTSNTWINGNGMPVVSNIQQQWPQVASNLNQTNYSQWLSNNAQGQAPPYMYPWPTVFSNAYSHQNGVPWPGRANFVGFPPGQQFCYEQMDQQ